MMNYHSTEQKYRLEEINVSELWSIIVQRKIVIILITMLFIISSVIYVWTIQPIYRGSVLLEIGEIIINTDPKNDKPTIIQPIENSSDLKAFLSQHSEYANLSVRLVGGSNKLVHIGYESYEKSVVKEKLENVVQGILEHQKSKVVFYQKASAQVSATRAVSDILVSFDSMQSQKFFMVVVAFFSGLAVGILIVLSGKFILRDTRKRDQSERS